jgi:trk system potassium uptake protein TrkH
LLVIPAPLFAAFEWSASLDGLPFLDKLHNTWFHIVSPRSAGFVALDPATYSPAGALLTMVLMFVGGSPLSTAGGVKTTTVALLWLAVIAALQGRTKATAFSRAIAHESIYRAVAIMTLYTVIGATALIGILLTQPRLGFLAAAFEVTSALGTVGMSLGATSGLDDVGKAILVVCMFMGRVGPLTMFLLLTDRQRTLKWSFPEETVTVG